MGCGIGCSPLDTARRRGSWWRGTGAVPGGGGRSREFAMAKM
ncbi:hypothetical protein A2U01_0119650, partial [Trifolium medium]|nr:hypothetical protein [Trifolium medium]